MRKVYDSKSYAYIYSPENFAKEPVSIIELAKAEHPAGYVFSSSQKNSAILHYVISGSFSYKGNHYTAPAMIIMLHGGNQKYTVDESCNNFFSYWIRCEGEMLNNLLNDVGIVSESIALPCEYMDEVTPILTELTTDASYDGKNETLFMLSGLFKLLSLYSGRHSQSEVNSVSVYTQTILEHIHANFNTQLTEKDMAGLVNLSTNYMHKIFLSDMKLTPIYYLNFYRIKQAKKLLSETDLSVALIADKVGISGGDYFCRVFRKYSGGISPTEYRKKARNRIIRKN